MLPFNFLKKLLRYAAHRYGTFRSLYMWICRPSGEEYALFLKKHGQFFAIGENCSIPYFTNITDPQYVKIGNNVRFSSCTLLGHNGAVNMLNIAYRKKLDSVGRIEIFDNVFVGHGAIVMPGVKIGPNAVVAAGSVVTKDVGEGDNVGGVPARPIGRVDDLVRKLEEENAQLPWRELILRRKRGFDPAMESELVAARVKHFFGSEQQG